MNGNAILKFSDSVIEKTGKLRRAYKIKLPDAIIAATALVHDLSLVTRNTSDFKKISELNCVNAHYK